MLMDPSSMVGELNPRLLLIGDYLQNASQVGGMYLLSSPPLYCQSTLDLDRYFGLSLDLSCYSYTDTDVDTNST